MDGWNGTVSDDGRDEMIQFEKVSFQYDDSEIGVSDIDLHVRKENVWF